MIRPQKNRFRKLRALDGRWEFRKDPMDLGLRKGWGKGFKKDRFLPVPASWNEQAQDLWDYLGPGWYQTTFRPFSSPRGSRTFLRFGSVHYHATVWLNGLRLGSHEGGHLPFQFEVTDIPRKGMDRLVVRVEGLLRPDRVPPGNVPFHPKDAFNNQFNPPASFDFFPYCGIQREVVLYSTPKESVRDLTVSTRSDGPTGLVHVQVAAPEGSEFRMKLSGHGRPLQVEGPSPETVFRVPQAKLWAPGSPSLYGLTVERMKNGRPVDRVDLPVGIRTFEVHGEKLLLNGKPISLKGFGRHEDSPRLGRGLTDRERQKDFRNMLAVGANSYRTSHYPYSEKDLDLADRLGFLVIDETPAVGLFFRKEGLKKRLALCRQMTRDMIERDKNHPSVVMWSLANEPHSHRPAALPFFKDLASLARTLDPTRPVTLVSYLGTKEASFSFLDTVCVNRYFGWYSEPGDLAKALPRLSKDLDSMGRRFKKPVLVTEFGADAIPGSHADPPALFSEEYQAALIDGYLRIMARKPFVAGAHVWNLNDFRTAQATHRPNGMNYKGVFGRDRKPKKAVRVLKRAWKGDR
ncbi:MAG TPA: glycoside hydrolase family 2 TIM barrel-domain containing protein [bacterium]|nr:glycoside hydrolase family 2 TIM barrel-domain containing protein [bacterium]